MANKQAAWQDEKIIGAITLWWKATFPFNEANADNTPPLFSVKSFVKLSDLYHSYYKWCVPADHYHYRLNENQFAKCLMAASIMDIGGVWRMATDWHPTADQIKRITGDE